MDMYEFFYEELKTLKARTGILQWEKLNEAADREKEVNDLIDFMLVEVNKDPFKKVNPAVIQRVISRAVIEDKDFIGLNAKFVRRALASWWEVNGNRVLMKLQEQEAAAAPKVELTKEQNDFVDTMVNSYVKRLLTEPAAGMTRLSKMPKQQAAKEGAEWTSNLERKASKYNNGLTPEQYAFKKHLQRTASDFYKSRVSYTGLKLFMVGEYEVFAESQQHAEEIYQIATNTK